MNDFERYAYDISLVIENDYNLHNEAIQAVLTMEFPSQVANHLSEMYHNRVFEVLEAGEKYAHHVGTTDGKAALSYVLEGVMLLREVATMMPMSVFDEIARDYWREYRNA